MKVQRGGETEAETSWHWQRGGERESKIPCAGSVPMSQELQDGLPCEWQKSKHKGHLLLFTDCSQGAALELAHPGIKPTSLGNAGLSGGGFTHCASTLAPKPNDSQDWKSRYESYFIVFAEGNTAIHNLHFLLGLYSKELLETLVCSANVGNVFIFILPVYLHHNPLYGFVLELFLYATYISLLFKLNFIFLSIEKLLLAVESCVTSPKDCK